jgi:hypothetical protein
MQLPALFIPRIRKRTAMWVLFVKLISPVEWWLEPKPRVHRQETTRPAT